MPFLRRLSQTIRRWQPIEEVGVQIAYAAIKILAALPSRWVLKFSDALGLVLAVIDHRGRDTAWQNMDVVFGPAMETRERKRVFRESYKQIVRSILLLMHLQPLTAKRYGTWVDTPEMRSAPETQLLRAKGGVLVSGHIGNWEMMLGLRVLFPDWPPTVFLAEQIPHAALNRVLKKLRSHPGIETAFRKGGARTVINTVAKGGTAGLLVDRNVRGHLGGVYAPFFGLSCRTSPLPAWIALRHNVPVFPIFCFPREDDRYHLWLGPNVAADLVGQDDATRMVELLTRINAVFEDVIRAQPELWNWTLKRFKSRPQVELDGHPPYSLHDPAR